MLYVCTSYEKFYTIGISVIRDLKKISHIKDVKIYFAKYIFGKLTKITIVLQIIKWPILFILISNEFIDFSESMWIFSISFRFWKFCWKFWKMDVTLRILDIFFVLTFYITQKNFLGDWTNSCTDIASIFLKNGILENVKKKRKNSYGFWKINKFIWNEKNDKLPDYLLNNFFTNLLITFRHYYYAK